MPTVKNNYGTGAQCNFWKLEKEEMEELNGSETA